MLDIMLVLCTVGEAKGATRGQCELAAEIAKHDTIHQKGTNCHKGYLFVIIIIVVVACVLISIVNIRHPCSRFESQGLDDGAPVS